MSQFLNTMFRNVFVFFTIGHFNQTKWFALFKKIRWNNKLVVFLGVRNWCMTLVKNFSGLSAFRNLRFITLISISKVLDILFDLWRSPITAFRLYRFGTLDDQCTGSLDVLQKTSVVMLSLLSLLLMILVSRNLQGFTSMVKFIFGWNLFKFSKIIWCSFFFLLLLISSTKHLLNNGFSGLTTLFSVLVIWISDKVTGRGPPIE